MKSRIFAILQLCIAFTVLLSNVGMPFLEELYTYKQRAVVYREVLGDPTLIAGSSERLQRNRQRFLSLSPERQQAIQEQYGNWQLLANQPFFEKIQRGFSLPPLKLAWILLAIVIPILLLLSNEGAQQAAWLLPLLALCYALFSRGETQNPVARLERELYPSEEMIVANYLEEPLSQNILEQHEQLKQGWQRYLEREWAYPSEAGEFAFNLARLSIWERYPGLPPPPAESRLTLLLYILWNLLFAWGVAHKEKKCKVQ